MKRLNNDFMHFIILANPIEDDFNKTVSESIGNLVTESILDSTV